MSRPVSDPYRRAQAALARQVSSRAAERDALMRVTRGLELAKESGNRMDMVKAVTQNQSLWMIFVTDVMGDANQLPRDLRKQIATVGLSVIKEMNENLHGNLDVDFLIEINRLFIEGLSTNVDGQSEPARPSGSSQWSSNA